MIPNKKITQHYFKTGILGAYETTEVVDAMEFGGKYAPCFDDALTDIDNRRAMIRRSMDIGGRRFCICSVFPTNAPNTPTDKLLKLIDGDLGKA
jgi:hypothetical protein